MRLRTWLGLLAIIAAGCGPEELLEEADPSMDEFDALLSPTRCEAGEECSGTEDVYSSLYRVGNSGSASSDVAQTFRPAVSGRPEALRLKLRLLRPLSTGKAFFRVRIVAAPNGLVSLEATPLATGQIDAGTLSRGLPEEESISLTTSTSLSASTDYAFIFTVDAPQGETALVGVASHKANTYLRGIASMRWTQGRGFSTAPGNYDLSFALKSGCTGSQTVGYTGEARTFVVPNCAETISVDAYGASGGNGSAQFVSGKGGRTQAKLTVTGGETLWLYVGGAGTAGTSTRAGTGGFNGGGAGGHSTQSPGYGGGGGGGATDIRRGGTSLDKRILVAGGGGGAGANLGCTGGTPGDGGGLVAANSSGCSGGPGTQTAGGEGATWGGKTGSKGSSGSGGASATGASSGGGGGGWFGGGGGAYAYGGGGSSYVTPTESSSIVHTRGVRSGHGTLTISW